MDMMRGGAHQCYGAVHARAVQDVGIGGLQVGTQRWPFSLGHLGAYVLHTSCPLHIGSALWRQDDRAAKFVRGH
jgi:hypothetical protein